MTSSDPKYQIVKFTCQEDDDKKLLVDILSTKTTLSKSLIKKTMSFGGVFQTTNNKRKHFRKAKNYVRAGDLIELYFDPKIDLSQTFYFHIIYQNQYYGIYHKPVGASSEGDNFGDQISVLRQAIKAKKRAYLVNRLDNDTEGLILIAYDSKTQNIFQSMWRDQVEKKYQGVVSGKLLKDSIIDNKINNKFTETHYQVKVESSDKSFLEITPITERKHQIRIHMSQIGHPILGDPIYNKKDSSSEKLQLICHSLKFIDPYSKTQIEAILPKKHLLF